MIPNHFSIGDIVMQKIIIISAILSIQSTFNMGSKFIVVGVFVVPCEWCVRV